MALDPAVLGHHPRAQVGVEWLDAPGQEGYGPVGRQVRRGDRGAVVDDGQEGEVGQDEDGSIKGKEDA